MKKKRVMTFLMLATGFASAAHAQSASKVIVKTATGDKTFNVADMKGFKFNDDGIAVVKKDGSQGELFEFDKITSIEFDVVDGIGRTQLPDGNLIVHSPAGSGLIYIDGYKQGEKYTTALYTIDGKLISKNDKWAGTPVDVSGLPDGIYLFKINNTTLKFKK